VTTDNSSNQFFPQLQAYYFKAELLGIVYFERESKYRTYYYNRRLVQVME
jgi:hypothetical protein